jgi:Co/Zn/Cd efflux system component
MDKHLTRKNLGARNSRSLTPSRRSKKKNSSPTSKKALSASMGVTTTNSNVNVDVVARGDTMERDTDDDEAHGRLFLKIALLTNTLLIAVQLVFTVVTGSLLLFADTIDGLIDSFSLTIPLLSVHVSRKCRTDHSCSLENVSNNTFKLLSLSLMVSYRVVVILNVAIELTREPELGNALFLIIIGAVGFILNFLTTLCVVKQEKGSHSAEEGHLLISTILHVLSDALGSLLVCGVGVFYFFTENEVAARYIDLSLTLCTSVVMIVIATRMLVKDITFKIKNH